MTRADVRNGERWSRSQRIKNTAIFALASTAIRGFGALSTPRLLRCGRVLGRLVHACGWHLRDTARRQLSVAFPTSSTAEIQALARQNFEQLGLGLAELVGIVRGHSLSNLPLGLRAQKFVDDYRAAPCGTLLCALHLGPWERVAHALVAAGLPLTTLARAPYDPRFQPLYDKLRRDHQVAVAYRESSAALRNAVRVLKRAEILGAPMDLRSRVPCTRVPFLGGECEAPRGPAELARRLHANVVVASVVPCARGGLEVDIETIAMASVAATLTTQQLTARIYAAFEQRIRAMPAQWPWLHDRQIDVARAGRISD
jgi:Kdo2-lipid IVA lauroyltransferase/acyltransferase